MRHARGCACRGYGLGSAPLDHDVQLHEGAFVKCAVGSQLAVHCTVGRAQNWVPHWGLCCDGSRLATGGKTLKRVTTGRMLAA